MPPSPLQTAARPEAVYKPDYRRDIDGLRAVAVIAVIANHLNHGWLPGGYLGVDIFFVISGYVITSSLGKASYPSLGTQLLSFYSRRIKRLMPALILMVLVASALIRLVDAVSQISILTGISSIFGTSNIFLFLQSTNYFGVAAQRNMFAHTWSLGVEEQFYLLYPFLIRWRRPLTARSFWDDRFRLGAIASLSVLSLGLFIASYRINQPAAYFLMPCRFWELGAGCLMALVAHICQTRGSGRPFKINPILPFLIILPGLVLAGKYPVSCTILVVLATAALIGSLRAESSVYRFLAHPATVYIGAISYSLYLWHWPVICLSYWTIGIHPWTLPIQIPLMLLLAAASYHLVENRLRRKEWTSSRWGVLAIGIPGMVTAVALLFAAQHFQFPKFAGNRQLEAGSDVPAPGYVARFSARKLDSCFAHSVFDTASAGQVRIHIENCTAQTPASPLRLVFVGDSTATDLFPLSDQLFKNGVATVINITQPGCKFPAVDVPVDQICDYPDRLLSNITPAQARNTVFVIRNNYAPRRINGELTTFARLLEQQLDRFSAAGVKVIYIAPSPKYESVGNLCSPQWYRPVWAMGPECKNGFQEDRSEQLARRQDVTEYLNSLAAKRKDFYVFDPFNVLCGSNDGLHCTPVRNGKLIYRDGTHLTAAGSELMAPSFIQFLRDHQLLTNRPEELHASL